MKKYMCIFLIIIIILCMTKQDELIRIRIIANSNSSYDQEIKQQVSKDVSTYLYSVLKDSKTIENARIKINDNLETISNIVEKDLYNVNYQYDINYGINYFPEKQYNGKTYASGNYESLLITLGEGNGDNWWCILFPPFCLIEAEEGENIEYSFFFDKLFTKNKNK